MNSGVLTDLFQQQTIVVP